MANEDLKKLRSAWEEHLGRMNRELRDLRVALEESVRLQSHYAALLNMHDGGERIQFEGADAWIERLRQTGTLPPNSPPGEPPQPAPSAPSR